jgi:hypothetical protein
LDSSERLIIYTTNGGPFEPAMPKHLVPSQPKVKRRVKFHSTTTYFYGRTGAGFPILFSSLHKALYFGQFTVSYV